MSYTTVDTIARIRLKLHKVLPAVYDESLSYLEGLAKLTYKVNETITAVNTLNDNVDMLNDSVTELDGRVTAVEEELEEFETTINTQFSTLTETLTTTVNNAISEMESNVDSKLSEVDAKISDLETYVTEKIAELTAELTALLEAEIEKIQEMYEEFEAEMKQYVEDKIAELIASIPDLTNIYVKSPASGQLVKVQVAINEIFDFGLYYALTCDEFNTLGLTIDELNDLIVKSIPRGFTVNEWLHDAKKLLIDQVDVDIVEAWVQPHSVVRDFLNGSKVWVERNTEINESMWAWSGSFTCNEIVTNNFTCDAINQFAITCTEYIMKANELMVAS